MADSSNLDRSSRNNDTARTSENFNESAVDSESDSEESNQGDEKSDQVENDLLADEADGSTMMSIEQNTQSLGISRHKKKSGLI